MKKRRFLSLIVAMLMVMSSCLPALAATSTTGITYNDSTNVVESTASVTITGIPYDTESTTGTAGITFTTYQILYATYNTTDNTIEYHLTSWAKDALVVGAPGTPASNQFSTEALAIAAILASENITVTTTPTPSTDGSTTTEQTDVLNTLAAYVVANNVDSLETGAPSNEIWSYTRAADANSTGSATATTLAVGAYLVVPTSSNMSFLNTMVSVNAEAGDDPSANTWKITSNGAVLKGTRVNITKQVKEEDDTDFANSTDAQIGETVTYQLKVTVPQFDWSISDTNITFTVVDTPTNVSIDLDSVTITPYTSGNVAGTALTNISDYTKRGGGVDSNGDPVALTIDLSTNYQNVFGKDANSSAYPYSYVIIEYTATVLSSAVSGSTGNENEAELTYGHTGVTENKVSATSLVYTYEAQLTKYGTSSALLAGAEFEIYTGTSYADQLTFVKNGDGDYSVYVSDGTTTPTTYTTVTTDSNGVVKITGLDSATSYKIVEYKAPSGYTLNTNYLTFTINGSTGQVNLDPTYQEYDASGNTVTASSGSWTCDDENNVLAMTLTDTQLAAIPSTGGVGIIVFTVLGVCLMIVAVFLLTSKDSKKKQAQ